MDTEPVYVESDVTLGLSTTGNHTALAICLATVFAGKVLPGKLVIRSEGQFPLLQDFYVEQLLAGLRSKGVSIEIHLADSKGVRVARDFHLSTCLTKYLWMVDDDVLFMPSALDDLLQAIKADTTLVYVTGPKPDITNRRGMKQFSSGQVDHGSVDTSGPSPNVNLPWTRRPSTAPLKVVPNLFPDTGSILIRVVPVKDRGIKFSPFRSFAGATGEDTLFGLQCADRKLKGAAILHEHAWHLDKPVSRFGETEARAELIARSAECLALDPPSAIDHYMKELPRTKDTNEEKT